MHYSSSHLHYNSFFSAICYSVIVAISITPHFSRLSLFAWRMVHCVALDFQLPPVKLPELHEVCMQCCMHVMEIFSCQTCLIYFFC